MQVKTLESFDSTRIAYQVGGRGDRWIVVANGYGGTFCAWTEVFRPLEEHYRILLWDYRGLFNSEIPRDRKRLTIEDNCRDLDCLMAAEGIERMVLAGWSVGVQVALEQYRRRPDAIEALILINGSHGRVLHRSLDGRAAGWVLAALLRPAVSLVPVVNRALLPGLRRLARTRWGTKILSLARVVNGEPASFREALQRVLEVDFSIYLTMGLYADQHDTEDLLSHVDVPTLVTAGSRDIITRPRVGKHVSACIPNAVYHEFPGGTHYTVMEFPNEVAGVIDEFITRSLERQGRG